VRSPGRRSDRANAGIKRCLVEGASHRLVEIAVLFDPERGGKDVAAGEPRRFRIRMRNRIGKRGRKIEPVGAITGVEERS
jgi:hypothetical protein